MNFHEAALYVVHKLKDETGQHVAAVFEAGNTTLHGFATDLRAGSAKGFKTPTANLLKGMSEAKRIAGVDYHLYTTYPPTKLCLGLGMRCHVTKAFHLNQQGSVFEQSTASLTSDPVALTDAAKAPGLWAIDPNTDITVMLQAAASENYAGQFTEQFANIIENAPFVDLKTKKFESNFSRPLSPPNLGYNGTVTANAQRIFMRTAAAMVGIQNKNGVLGNNIGTIIVGPNQGIMAFGINTNTGDNTQHAETNSLVQIDAITNGAGIPEGSYLFTTLRSCDMCAAAISTVANGSINVQFGEADPKVGGTVLSGMEGTERRSDLQLRPQARARWAMLSSIVPQLAAAGPIHAAKKERDRIQQLPKKDPSKREALKQAKINFGTASQNLQSAKAAYKDAGTHNVTGRLTHNAATTYFYNQLIAPNEIATPEDDQALTHCAKFLIWFEQNIRPI